MTLVSCPECKKEISDKATSCPQCGAPASEKLQNSQSPTSHTKVTRTGAKWEGGGFLLIIAGIFISISTISNSDNHVGGIMILVGFFVFLIGRFK